MNLRRPITRLRLLCLAGLVWLGAGVAGEAKIPRMCFLTFDPGTLQHRSPAYDGFFDLLRQRGYIDGRTIDIAYLSADNNGGGYPALIDRCLQLKPDVIAVTTTPAALLLKNATHTVPIVMVGLGDPVGAGVVDSLARPSGNITGTSLMIPELAAKRLQLLKELVPGMTQALVLAVLSDPMGSLQVKAIERMAGSLGIVLQVRDIHVASDIPRAFADTAEKNAQGALVTTESMFNVHGAEVTGLAARYKLPAIYGSRYPVTDAGGLMAYAVDGPEMFRAAADYVDRLLKGAEVSELPVQQPTSFPLIVNLNTAKALGLTIPPALLARATQVIE